MKILRVGMLACVPFLGGCDQKVASPQDDVPPEVSVAAPADGSSVSGTAFRVDVNATDDVGVDEVRVRARGELVAMDTEPPYSLVVITLSDSAGTAIVIEVEAVDAAGNSTTASATYTVQSRRITRLTNHPNSDTNPAWRPDGMRIAFQAKRSGDQFDLWTINPDGTAPSQLTGDVNEDRNPAWSPDGQWLAFDTDRAGTYDIWVLPIAGGESQASAVTFGTRDDIQPAWSPDGENLYFASNRGSNAPFNLWRQPMSGGSAVQVTSFADNDTAPALSPDGATLAFASTLNFGAKHIYTMPVGSVQVTPLTGDVGFTETDPAWQTDSHVVTYSRDDGVDSNLWTQAGPESPPRQATFGSGLFGDGGGAWSPDGTRLAFHSDRDGNLEIYVVE